MIVSIDISESGEYLFIRSSSGISTSLITITKMDGSVVFSHTLNAFDLTMEWNPYNEQQIFIAAFSEDWQEQIYFLSIADKKITETADYDPFSKWYALEQLVYLNWIGENTSLSADLILQDLNSGEEKKLLTGIFHLDTFKDVLLTIEGDPSNHDQAVYHFYGKNMKKLGSFIIPQVLSFSSQLIPYYDYQAEKKTFIFLQPVMKDVYNEEFQLMKFDAEANQVQEIIDGLKNEPLSCSRDGNYCLYGYNFEKLIDLNKKKIMKLTS
jgi:Tol biopolymer transport system component